MILGVLYLFLSSCAFEAKGIPVKKFMPREVASAPSIEQRKEMEAEIIKLSRITENSVFTERRGISEYIIGPSDVLKITRWDLNKPVEYETVVRPDGKISYAYIHDIPVGGHTANEVDEILTKALKKYIRNPRIDILVKTFKSKSALLFGQINRLQTGVSGPGKYPLKGKMRILDLIVTAGGPIQGEEFANADLRHVEVVRRGKIYTVNLFNSMFKGDMSQNILIDDGDIVTVPELPDFGERIYVFGEVKSQGIYKLKDAYDLLAALSKAGGTTIVAVDADIRIIRGYQENWEKPVILTANLDEILKKGDISQNIALEDGDVVYVPRTVIGDVNEFIVNTVPFLDYLFFPQRYRDAYSNSADTALRF